MRKELFPTIVFILGLVCLMWIVYDIIKIYTDLGSIIQPWGGGLYIGIGYIFIITFHLLFLTFYILHFRHNEHLFIRHGLPVLLVVSFLSLMMEKVMFDEVGHEYLIEYPMPGETHFIVFGLLVNTFFILCTLYSIYREFNVFFVYRNHYKKNA